MKIELNSVSSIYKDIAKIKRVLENSGIVVRSVKLFKEGTLRATFKVITESTDYVVKLSSNLDIERVKLEIENLKKISTVTDLAVCPLNAEPLIFGSKVGYYYKFFNGKMLNHRCINNLYYRFGVVVGEFDNALKALPFNHQEQTQRLINHMTKINSLPIDAIHSEDTLSLIKKGLTKINKEWSNIEVSNLRTQFIHKDLHFNNVLYNKNNDKFFIIDMAGLSVQFLAKEISVIIGNEFISRDVINFQIISDIVNGYSDRVLLNEDEVRAIPIFVIEKKIGELNFLQEQFNNGGITLRMYNKYKRLSTNNLREIIEKYNLIASFLSKCYKDIKKQRYV